MKYFLISDSHDTRVGIRLAGIEGVTVNTREAVRDAIQTAAADPNIAVLLITEKCAKLCPELVTEMKLTLATPLVVEIPDRHGTSREANSITKHIQESIGVKLD